MRRPGNNSGEVSMKRMILGSLLFAVLLLLAGCIIDEDVDDVSITYDSQSGRVCVQVPRSYGTEENELDVESFEAWVLFPGSGGPQYIGKEEGYKMYFPLPAAEAWKASIRIWFADGQQYNRLYQVQIVGEDLTYYEL